MIDTRATTSVALSDRAKGAQQCYQDLRLRSYG